MDHVSASRCRSVSAPDELSSYLGRTYYHHNTPVIGMSSAAFLNIPPSDPSSLSTRVPNSYYPVLLEHSQSYPCSPNLASAQRQRPHSAMTQMSPSVFQSNAQGPRPVREATLHSKNPLVATSSCPSRPKLHLYASRKTVKSEPTVDEMPEPPVEWLVGTSRTPSSESSMTSSEAQSGDSSDDDGESDYQRKSPNDDLEPRSPGSEAGTSGAVVGRDTSAACHYLSVGLKALLKVQA